MPIQETVEEAVHGQPALPLTVNEYAPPAAGSGWLGGPAMERHGPVCVMTKNWSAARMPPVRVVLCGLGAMEKCTSPLVVTVSMTIQEAPDSNVQRQPDFTVNAPLSPAGPKEAEAGSRVYSQTAAAWVMVKVRPAAVMVPVRGEGVLLAAADHPAEPLPSPVCP